MLKITGNGTVCFDPTCEYSKQGKAWMRMRVVSKERVRDGQGKWVDGNETFFNVTVFGKQAEMLYESGVSKGTRIVFTGKAGMRDWTNKDGEKKTDLDVIADEIGLDVTFTAYRKMEAGDRSSGKHEPAPTRPFDDGSPF